MALSPGKVYCSKETDLSCSEQLTPTQTEKAKPSEPKKDEPKKIIGEGITVPSVRDASATRPSSVGKKRSPQRGMPLGLASPLRVGVKPASLSSLPDTVSAMAGLPMAENSYDEISMIGTGAYGTVYKGRQKNAPEEKLVALKKLRMMLSDEGVPVNALREIALLKQLEKYNHPNIVKLLDICHGRVERTSRLNLILVFEYIEQDLELYMKKCPSPGLEPAMIQNLMHQILCGIDFLHTHRIVHRDMKPQNILVSRHNVVKIADFGLAKVYDFYSKLTTMVVTLWYRSPEVLFSNSYATPVDLWACGCIFAELFKRKPLFEGQTEGEQLQRIFNVIGKPTEDEWPDDVSLLPSNFRDHPPVNIEDVVPELTPEAANLLKKLLIFTPGNRISAKDALAHPYFSGLTPPTISPLRNPISQQMLCHTTAYGSRGRGASPNRGMSPMSNQSQELLRRACWDPLISPGGPCPFPPTPRTMADREIPPNDENNPNAGNSANDSYPRTVTKSPISRCSTKSPSNMEE